MKIVNENIKGCVKKLAHNFTIKRVAIMWSDYSKLLDSFKYITLMVLVPSIAAPSIPPKLQEEVKKVTDSVNSK